MTSIFSQTVVHCFSLHYDLSNWASVCLAHWCIFTLKQVELVFGTENRCFVLDGGPDASVFGKGHTSHRSGVGLRPFSAVSSYLHASQKIVTEVGQWTVSLLSLLLVYCRSRSVTALQRRGGATE